MSGIDEKKIYNENWRQWESMKIHGPMSRHVRRLVFNACGSLSFSSVLDVGCGPGIFLAELHRRYPSARLAGVDISEEGVALARRNLPSAGFSVCDIARQTPAGSFDLITLVDVAEHIEDDCAAFKNLASICTGHIVIATLEGRMREFEKDIGHVRNYAPGELPGKLESAGFEVVRYLHWGWPTYSPLYRNLSAGIAADKNEMTPLRKFLGRIAYWVLGCNVPGKGDIIIVVGKRKTGNA
jgi:SAM-dependent methyltransferase